MTPRTARGSILIGVAAFAGTSLAILAHAALTATPALV
jgi:hypothetical protein